MFTILSIPCYLVVLALQAMVAEVWLHVWRRIMVVEDHRFSAEQDFHVAAFLESAGVITML